MQSTGFPFRHALSVAGIDSVRHFLCSSSISLTASPVSSYTLLYIASQEVILSAGQGFFPLRAGDAWLFPASSPPVLRPKHPVAFCPLLISFSCLFPLPDCLLERAFTFTEKENGILAQLLLEIKEEPDLHDPICCLFLELLLWLLIRRCPKSPEDGRIWHSLLSYLQSRLNTSLTLSQICHDNSISRSRLEKIFQEKAGCGAMTFFSRMKIEAAKELIRSGGMNDTQIAAALGYSSVHYFSRQFKKGTKMTPTQYSHFTSKYSGTSPISLADPSQQIKL